MKKKVFLFIIFVLLACSFTLSFQEMSGREVIEKHKDLNRCQTEFIDQNMTLVDRGGREEVRRVNNYKMEVEKDVDRTLFVFLTPADVKGTALLTWQHKNQEDDQWLYLPARGKMQRIAAGGKKNYFMGTDFTYEDLQGEDVDDYSYAILREENIGEGPCYVIEAIPANEEVKKKSAYSKRILWITKQQYRAEKIEFYDSREKLIKTQTNGDWENPTGTIWRAGKILMDNHMKRHKTIFESINREINQSIDEQTFTSRFILMGRHTR